MKHRFSTAAKVRPQRRWQMDHHDATQGGYAHRLPPEARAWLERFDREVYAVDAAKVRNGLHADRLKPEAEDALAALPAQVVERYRLLVTKEPEKGLRFALRVLGLGEEAVDSSRRRALYGEQNAATRDAYSLGRVVRMEEMT